MDMHDSIEDARTALRLWKKYEMYQQECRLEETLEYIYRKGAEVRFKAPGGLKEDSLGVSGALTPGRNTPGRITPEPSIRADIFGELASGPRSEAGTPVKKMGFGGGKVGFGGSPMR